jgi:hypothetical protein
MRRYWRYDLSKIELKGEIMKRVKQADLSSECFVAQLWGTGECVTYEYRDTDECGGKKVRATGKNSKGIAVPLG